MSVEANINELEADILLKNLQAILLDKDGDSVIYQNAALWAPAEVK